MKGGRHPNATRRPLARSPDLPRPGRAVPLAIVGPLVAWAVAYVLVVIVPVTRPVARFAQDVAAPPLVLFACAVAGYTLLDRLKVEWLGGVERLLAGAGLGLGALGLATFALDLAGWTNLRLAPPLLLLLGASRLPRLGADLARWRAEAAAALGALSWTALGLGAAMAALLVWGAWDLPIDHETLSRYLAFPKAHLAAGRIGETPADVFGWFPQGGQMLFQMAMSLRWVAGRMHDSVESGVLLANVFNAYLVVLAACGVAAWAARAFGPRAAPPAAALLLALPAVYRAGHNACTESPQVLYTVLALLALAAYRDRRTVGPAVLAGVLTGLAMGVTFAAAVLLFVPALVYLAVDGLARRPRRTGLWAAVGYASAAVLVVAPWLVRNLAGTGSPVHPFLTGLLGPGPHWTVAEASRFAAAYAPPPNLVASLGRAIAPESVLAAVPVVLLVGLGAVALAVALAGARDRSAKEALADRRPSALYLAAYAAIVFLGWFLTSPHLGRHLAPLWPPLAALAAGGLVVAAQAARWRRAASAAALAAVLAGMIYALGSERAAAREQLLRGLPPEATSADRQPDYSGYVVEWLNRGLDLPKAWRERPPAGAPVAVGLVGEDRTLFFVRPTVYGTVWDRPWLAGAIDAWRKTGSADEVRAELARLGVGTVYVNWLAIERLEGPARAAWPGAIDRVLLDAWVAAGVLEPLGSFGRPARAGDPAPHVLYRVAYSATVGR